MSARRVRTPGNPPATRLYCDWVSKTGDYCPTNAVPVSGWDAREVRRLAKRLGWVRVNGKDYCPDHSCPHGYVPGDHHYEGGCRGGMRSELLRLAEWCDANRTSPTTAELRAIAGLPNADAADEEESA